MSAGSFVKQAIYQDNFGAFYPIRVQPETLTLTIATVANAQAAGPLPPNVPSVSVSRGRQSNGVNAKLVRIRFTNTIPPGYLPTGTISLPVLTNSAYAAYSPGATGTYTLEGTAYDVEVVGRTPETIK